MHANLLEQHETSNGYRKRLHHLLHEAEKANEKEPEKDETGADILYWDKSVHF